jgi:hypothetical protein
MVFKHFCSKMIETFGSNEQSSEVVAAFVYARSAYDYLSPSEIETVMKDNRRQGICSHGLTEDTCPCGCFEFSGTEEFENFSPDETILEDDCELIAKEWAEKVERWRQEEILGTSGSGLKANVLNAKNACMRSFLKILRIRH